MIRRNRLINAVMVVWLAAWIGALVALAPVAPAAGAGPSATPWGSIGDPVTGTRKPKHTHKPPKEPRLTMPPTDTQ